MIRFLRAQLHLCAKALAIAAAAVILLDLASILWWFAFCTNYGYVGVNAGQILIMWPSGRGWNGGFNPGWSIYRSPIAHHWGVQVSPSAMFQVVIPLWMLAIILAACPAALWYRNKRRQTPGHCPHCRYDLSGLPPDAPCPECGSIPSSP